MGSPQAFQRMTDQVFMLLPRYAEPANDNCDSLYCDPRVCHGVIITTNSGEAIKCKCSCHKG